MKESLEDYKTSITNSITLIVQEFLSSFLHRFEIH